MVHYLDASRFESCCMHLHTVLLQMKLQSIGYIVPGNIFQMTVKVLLVTVDMGSPSQVCKMYFANQLS